MLCYLQYLDYFLFRYICGKQTLQETFFVNMSMYLWYELVNGWRILVR